MYTREEYAAKQKQLTELAKSIDLWKQSRQTKAQIQELRKLTETLQAEIFSLECAFLDLKSRIFVDMLAVYKKKK